RDHARGEPDHPHPRGTRRARSLPGLEPRHRPARGRARAATPSLRLQGPGIITSDQGEKCVISALTTYTPAFTDDGRTGCQAPCALVATRRSLGFAAPSATGSYFSTPVAGSMSFVALGPISNTGPTSEPGPGGSTSWIVMATLDSSAPGGICTLSRPS